MRRKSLSYSADTYPIARAKNNIDALLHGAKIAVTGTNKYFTDEFISKAISGTR